jgi:hypothetical protein
MKPAGVPKENLHCTVRSGQVASANAQREFVEHWQAAYLRRAQVIATASHRAAK